MGMILAHGGIAVAIIGVVITTYYEGRDVRMEPGDKLGLSGYQFEFLGVEKIRGPNYISDQGEILVTREGQKIAFSGQRNVSTRSHKTL